MKIMLTLCLLGALDSGLVMAKDSFNSEISHVAGFSLMAGGVTTLADHYGYQPQRAWIGFGVSATVGALSEVVESLRGGGEVSVLDIGANILGSALGSVVTDHWFLRPVVRQQDHYAGLTAQYFF